jgi:hypothetical protein
MELSARRRGDARWLNRLRGLPAPRVGFAQRNVDRANIRRGRRPKNEIVAMTGVTLRASLNNIVASRLVNDCVGRARENPVFNYIAAAREIDGAARQQVHKNLVTAAAYQDPATRTDRADTIAASRDL